MFLPLPLPLRVLIITRIHTRWKISKERHVIDSSNFELEEKERPVTIEKLPDMHVNTAVGSFTVKM